MLGKASTFVEAARLACEESKRLGALHCSIVLHRDGGPVVLAIEDASDAPVGESCSSPLMTASGWCGLIKFVISSEYNAAIERELAMLATQLCVWCTEHGISAVPALDELGPRQHRIAELAARGRTNAEIAVALAISINTVKSRLKEVFERLGVNNRTELANVMRRLAPLHGVPPGVTYYKSVVVTRAPAPPPARSKRRGAARPR